MDFQPPLVDRRRIAAAKSQEPQETGADADFGIVGVHPAPLLALVAGEGRIEERTQRGGIGLDLAGKIRVRARRALHMPHKLAEEVAQHARLRLDFLARLLRQVKRIVAQERREELILQLDGIGRRGAKAWVTALAASR